MKNELLTAFYHKGRKQFVSWLASEIARRVDRDQDDVLPALRGMAIAGLAKTQRTHLAKDGASWQLTPAGQAEARAMIAAEAFAKGGNA